MKDLEQEYSKAKFKNMGEWVQISDPVIKDTPTFAMIVPGGLVINKDNALCHAPCAFDEAMSFIHGVDEE